MGKVRQCANAAVDGVPQFRLGAVRAEGGFAVDGLIFRIGDEKDVEIIGTPLVEAQVRIGGQNLGYAFRFEPGGGRSVTGIELIRAAGVRVNLCRIEAS
jgi:hypothetical protein